MKGLNIEFEGHLTMKEVKNNAADLCKERVDMAGAQNVIKMTKSTELSDYEDTSFYNRKRRKIVFGIIWGLLIFWSLSIFVLNSYVPAVKQFLDVHPYLIWINVIVLYVHSRVQLLL